VRRRALAAAALMALVTVTGCRMGPSLPERTDFFTATITGDVSFQFTGSGLFHPGDAQYAWAITSFGRNTSQQHGIVLAHLGGGAPTVGSHTAGPVGGALPAPDFALEWQRPDGPHLDVFLSIAGTVVMTTVTAQLVEGNFEVMARRFERCEITFSGLNCVRDDPETAPVVRMEGAFSAQRAP
jgi:hypothetical protein